MMFALEDMILDHVSSDSKCKCYSKNKSNNFKCHIVMIQSNADHDIVSCQQFEVMHLLWPKKKIPFKELWWI